MDISQYIKKTGRKNHEYIDGELKEIEEEIISPEDIAEILEGKDGKLRLFSVSTSIYYDEKHIGGGFFSRAFNINHILSKNYLPAEQKFITLHENLCTHHWHLSSRGKKLSNKKLTSKGDVNFGLSIFNLSYAGDLTFMNVWYKSGRDAIGIGDKVMLGLNRRTVSLDNIVYSDKHKALCYTYESYVTEYIPIVLD